MSEQPPKPVNPGSTGSNITSTIIPYKNICALISYYTGIASLIPILHIVLAPIAIILGVIGLIVRMNKPEAKGSLHAIVGIACGFGSGIVWCALGYILTQF